MNEIEKLEEGIAALESQRNTLGDAVVDVMIASARARLAELRAQQAQPLHAEQRKQATILFADMAGFTAFSETVDAEDMREQMNALWTRLDAIIVQHGGVVDKHIGDAVMALWSVESAREDDPERAIYAALAMQADMADFHKTRHSSLAMRIGINTGPVMLGAVGSAGEFTAMGDTVNLASRLQNLSPLGGILISHHTYRHVRGVFDFIAQEPLVVKGKADPVQTYVVLRRKPRAFRLRTRGVEGVETRMVGREEQLLRLQDVFHDVKKRRTPRTVVVAGEAGVGKSRLLYEFQNWLDLLPEFINIFRGRATESWQRLPYSLLRDVFSYRFEIADSDSLASAHSKLERGITDFMAGDEDAVMKSHFIGHLIGLDYSSSPFLRSILDDPKQIRNRAFHYLSQFFEATSMERRIMGVLFLDDLHWADDGSLDALAHVAASSSRSLPFLTIGLTRPSLFERRPDWRGDLRLDLSPLSDVESHQLLDEIFKKTPTVPQELRDIVVGGAEGNPFFLEELVKMLIDQKVILPGETVWEVEPARLAAVRVPSTLVGVLQARLDNLPEPERDTMQRASVVGRVFWDSAVRSLSDEPQAVPAGVFRSLRGRELIFERENSMFADTREYIFKHALLREVAYESVLKRLRRVYHARAAAWLVEKSGERANEYAGLIAEHFELAGQSAEAAQWYARAGGVSSSRSAFATAVMYFGRALQLLPRDQADYSVLSRHSGEASLHLGDFAAARRAFELADETAQRVDDRAEALALQAEVAGEMGEYATAVDLLAEALPLARESSNRLTLTRALFALGSSQWRLGKLEESRATFDECLSLSRAHGDVTRELFALNRLGAVVLTMGNLEEAERLWREVHTRGLAVGNRDRAMAALNNLGSVASTRKEYHAAREYISGALEMGRELGAQHMVALGLINLAELDIHLGNLAEARSGLREGLSIALRLGSNTRVLGAVIFFAELAYAEKDVDRSLALWGLARNHPAWHNELQRAMNMAFDSWKLDPAVVDAGLAHGAQLDWDATLRELLDQAD